jgi:hypothetical protein
MSGKVQHKCGHISTAKLCIVCWLKKKQPYFFLRSDANGMIISGHNCHSIRETLKSRGYRPQRLSWRKTLADDAERNAEFLWITEQGFPIAEIPDKPSD